MKKITLLILPFVLLGTGCSNKNRVDDKNIVIGCSPTPHAIILQAAKPMLETNYPGYKLTIKIINDYVTPNLLLESGDLDANYFQHRPYLNDFNLNNNTHLEWLLKMHFEPMGIYSRNHEDLTKSNPVIAIPNDTSNGARARALVESLEIENVSYREIEAQALPSVLGDVDYAVINGNYALSSKITDLCLAKEPSDSETADTNANVIVIKNTSVNCEWVQPLVETLHCGAMREFINTNFGSAVSAVF